MKGNCAEMKCRADATKCQVTGPITVIGGKGRGQPSHGGAHGKAILCQAAAIVARKATRAAVVTLGRSACRARSAHTHCQSSRCEGCLARRRAQRACQRCCSAKPRRGSSADSWATARGSDRGTAVATAPRMLALPPVPWGCPDVPAPRGWLHWLELLLSELVEGLLLQEGSLKPKPHTWRPETGGREGQHSLTPVQQTGPA